MINFSDIPSDRSCKEVNPRLFLLFQKAYLKQTHQLATPLWTEAEVVQWLDTEMDKYDYEKLAQNFR